MRTLQKSQVISLLTAIAMLLVGCTTPTHERRFMIQAAADVPQIRKAPFNGQYRLYSNPPNSPTVRNATPLLESRLNKGDRIGFASSEAGQLLAVIAGQTKPIPDSAATSYTWTMQPDRGQIDPVLTIALLFTVAVVGIAIGFAAVPDPLGSFGN
jgi:hypothetical protein